MFIRRSGLIVPYVMLRQDTTPTVLATSLYTPIVWDNAAEDPYNMLVGPANVSVRVPIEGLYLCEGTVTYAGSGVGRRFVALQFTGTQWRGTSVLPVPSGSPTTGVSRVMRLHAGSLINLAAFQDTGGNLNTAPGTENSPYFNVIFLGAGK